MNTAQKPNVFYVMGVSGCGKSAVGRLLAQELQLPFFDADDYHPQANIDKMSRGESLNDADREPWLAILHQLASKHLHTGCVIACSALKKTYRQQLAWQIEKHVAWVYLKGSYELIYQRMRQRKNHFMDPTLLKSQFDTLEEPEGALSMDILNTPEVIVKNIKRTLQ